MAECRSCGAPIRWVVTMTGKRIPLDRQPDPDKGNVRRVEQYGGELRAHVLTSSDAEAARGEGEPLWVAHFTTCPNADAHRSRPPRPTG